MVGQKGTMPIVEPLWYWVDLGKHFLSNVYEFECVSVYAYNKYKFVLLSYVHNQRQEYLFATWSDTHWTKQKYQSGLWRAGFTLLGLALPGPENALSGLMMSFGWHFVPFPTKWGKWKLHFAAPHHLSDSNINNKFKVTVQRDLSGLKWTHLKGSSKREKRGDFQQILPAPRPVRAH